MYETDKHPDLRGRDTQWERDQPWERDAEQKSHWRRQHRKPENPAADDLGSALSRFLPAPGRQLSGDGGERCWSQQQP